MKKIVSLLLVCLMIFGVMTLAGCGETKTETNTNETEAATGGEETPAAAGSAIKIGGTGPLTGGAAIYGNAAKNGAEIAVKEINALGGLQFELKYEDDTHDAEKAVNAFNTLKDWGMQVSLGSVTSKPAVATSQESENLFFLTPSASSTDVLGGVENPLTGTVEIDRKPTVFQM